jgi:hypothetical protein
VSAPAARAFLPALRQLERELSVPLPERVRILRELEFDLEQLRDRFVAQGMPTEEARSRAVEALVPEGTALGELRRLHMPLYLRATRHLGGDRLRQLERTALGLAVASVLLVETLTLMRADLLRDPSPFLWPVLALGGLLFTAIAAKVFQLWVKRDHGASARGLGVILVLSGVVLAMGLAGTLFDFYYLAGILEGSPELAGTLAPQWLVRDAALLSVSMLFALAGALTWFVLSQWIALVSRAHLEVLGLERSTTSPKEMGRWK